MSFNSFRDNLPAGFNGIEGGELEVYVYEIHGELEVDGEWIEVYLEVEIEGYNEEDADIELEQDLQKNLIEGFRNGEVFGSYVEEFEENIGYYLEKAYRNGDIEII